MDTTKSEPQTILRVITMCQGKPPNWNKCAALVGNADNTDYACVGAENVRGNLSIFLAILNCSNKIKSLKSQRGLTLLVSGSLPRQGLYRLRFGNWELGREDRLVFNVMNLRYHLLYPSEYVQKVLKCTDP